MQSLKKFVPQVQLALSTLSDTLGGNEVQIRRVISTFIEETPKELSLLQSCIHLQQWAAAAAIVHKIKIRYEYCGMPDLVNELSQWEEKLKNESANKEQTVELQFINEIQDITRMIIVQLKVSDHFEIQHTQTKVLQLTGHLVLIAEDDETNGLVFELFVKELGAQAIRATDGNEAVRLAIETNPDLIFMDIHMPFLSGIDAIKLLRSKGIKCPIISLSASTRLNEKQNSLDAGANSFLIKPATRESINTALLKYLQ
jgi:CheY-like chemotaxis protein/HPt (histidine-containing phosphotransfer) domain-containing protein